MKGKPQPLYRHCGASGTYNIERGFRVMKKWMGLVLVIALLGPVLSSCESLPEFERYDPREHYIYEDLISEEEMMGGP